MKKMLLPLLGILLLTACEKEPAAPTITEADQTIEFRAKKGKIDVCHNGNIINISENAWPAHEAHGDVRLDDQDDDGYVPDNDCGFTGTNGMGDCDDANDAVNPGVEEVCNNGIDDDCDGETDEDCGCTIGVEIMSGGQPLYVNTVDIPGTYNWADAIAACDNLVTADCFDEWVLPSKDELHDLFLNKDDIGGFSGPFYWSSTEVDADRAWQQFFSGSGFQNPTLKVLGNHCRCVHR